MKKLISLGLALGLTCASAFSQGANITHRPQSFINGFGNLVLTNNITITNLVPWYSTGATTNIPYTLGASNIYYAYPINALGGATVIGYVQANNTNYLPSIVVPGFSTNSSGSIPFPPAFRDVTVVPDANAVASTASITVVLNNTNIVFDNTFNVPPAYTNPPAPITLVGACTNVVTLQFIASKDGVNFSTLSSDQFQFTAQAYSTNAVNAQSAAVGTGLVPVVVHTNLPAAFMQNTKKIRCYLLSADNKTSSVGVLISQLDFSQFSP